MPVAVRTKRFVPKPANPEADPRFKGVKEKIGQKSNALKKHPPAKQKAGEAAKAAKGPPNEKAAGAKDKQVDAMKEAPAETPPADSFLTTLRAEIEKVMPATAEDADKFMEGGDEAQMKGAVGGNVKEQKETASGDLQSASNEPPNEGGVPAKEVAAMPPDPAAPVPSVSAAPGMPAPKPPEEISQKQTKADAETQLKENKLSKKRLANKDPRFEKVSAEKGKVDATADASPGKYTSQEKNVLGKAASQANSTAKSGLTAVVGVKNKSKSAVQSRQEAQKAKDEQRRKKVTDDIELIYNQTKQKVDNNLNSLERDVMAIFDPGSAAAIAAFKSNTNRDVDKFFSKRYSGLSGAADWILDKFKPTPPEVKQIIQQNLQKFTASMDALAVRVAGFVDKRLNQAKTDIEKGQGKIKSYVASLPKDLQSVGKEAETAMSARFDEMKQGVEAKKNDLAQKLAQKYKEAHDKANELAKKIEEENAGAFAGLIAAIGEVIKIILEFKDKLMALLRKAADTIDLILDDPIGFLGNLIAAIKAGVGQFVGNIWTHLKKGFMEWLFGSLASAGIEVPADLSLVSIFKLVMGVLGLTLPRLKAKAIKLLGPTAVAVITKLVEYVSALITGGPAKLWEQVKSDIGDLKAMVIDAIQDWLITTVIKQATVKLLSFFNPAGAFVQAVLAIYNLVMFLIERASQIMSFVEAVVNSVSSIAQGAIGAAANWIEQSLARMIPIVISFLARLIGLGGISQKIKEFITKVQTKVDQAIDKAIGKIVAFIKKMFGKLTGKGDKNDERTEAQKTTDVKAAVAEGIKLVKGEKLLSKDVNKKLPAIKKKYRLTSLEAVVASGTETQESIKIKGVINPEDEKKETVDQTEYYNKNKDNIKPPTGAHTVELAKSRSGNWRIFAVQDAQKTHKFDISKESWQGFSTEKNENVKKAEEELLAKLKAEMPGWVSLFKEEKGQSAPGVDVGGIAPVAPAPAAGMPDNRIIKGEPGSERIVVGEAKHSGAAKGRAIPISEIFKGGAVLGKRLGGMGQEADKKGSLEKFNAALQAGNVTIVIYLAGRAVMGPDKRVKLEQVIKTSISTHVKTRFPDVKIEEVAANVRVTYIEQRGGS
jgi:hypothetical protein